MEHGSCSSGGGETRWICCVSPIVVPPVRRVRIIRSETSRFNRRPTAPRNRARGVVSGQVIQEHGTCSIPTLAACEKSFA